MFREIRIFIFIIVVFLFVPSIFAEETRQYWYDNINVSIKVNSDSTVDIEETQNYHFVGSYHQGWRSIPYDKISTISHISVADAENGQALKFSARRLNKEEPSSWGKYTYFEDGGAINIEWYYDFRDTNHSWTIKYKVHGAIGFYTSNDGLGWNIFTDYDVPVRRSDVALELPSGADFINYSGERDNSVGASSSHLSGDNKVYFSGEDFYAKEDFTVYATWPKGVVSEKAFWLDFINIYFAYIFSIFVVFTCLLIGIIYHFKIERIRKGGPIIVPQYDPPKNLRPAMAEVIVKEKITPKGWAATVVDLAIRGFVKIEEDKNGFFTKISKFFGSTNYIIHKIKNFDNDPVLEDYERKYLQILFNAKGHFSDYFSTRELKKSQSKAHKLYLSMQALKEDLYKEAEIDTYAYDVGPAQEKWEKIIWALAGIAIAVGFIGLASNTLSLFLVIGGSVAALWGFIKYEARLNASGKLLKEEWLGFKYYLEIAETLRMQNLTPEIFEKYLPYAMIFGVEKKWARAFEAISMPPPNWYSGGVYAGGSGGFSGPGASSFSPSAFSSSFSSSFTSAFSSSGGGGGGGGGAGGGGGGGGGGAS